MEDSPLTATTTNKFERATISSAIAKRDVRDHDSGRPRAYSVGVSPVSFLKASLNAVFELKPDAKRFNDTWGHLVGDQVIRFIAAVLRQHANGDLLAARYGGEEFAVILPRTQLGRARLLGTAIHQDVKSKRLSRRSTGESLGALTISIGIAEYRNGESMSSLISRADSCLYASKRGGRDRITTDAEHAHVSAA